jgi:hypothetical protein
MEILLQAPKYLYEVFMTQLKYGIKNPYGIDLQLLKLEHYNDLNNLYEEKDEQENKENRSTNRFYKSH